MANISDFRRKKLLHVFHAFFDTNRSGTIEEKDFELAVEKIRSMRGWSEGDAKFTETRDALLLIWESLRKRADADNDQTVTTDEWCQMWTQDDSDADWQQRYLDFMFALEDTSCDGAIDEEEFVKVYKNYDLSEDECRTAFRKFSENNSIRVTKEVFSQLWKEYFLSDNPDALGNFIFGKTKFD